VLVAAIAVQAAAIAASWGGRYWLFGAAAGAVVSVITLVRRLHLGWAAVAGLAVAASAMLVASVAGLPREPGLAMALGLSVLVGSAIRTLSATPTGAIAAGGFAVVVGAWLPRGFTAVSLLNTIGWLAAVAIGLTLRLFDARRRAVAENVRRDERLELARELHDVVAHHITGIVLQAQAAQLVARRHPEQLGSSLAGIEAAGSDALAAMRRVVGLLRNVDSVGDVGNVGNFGDVDVAAASALAIPSRERLSDLAKRFESQSRTVHLRMPDGDRDGESVWPPEVASTVYRVVQESLTNIARHAPNARTVTISVVQDPRTIVVEVVDDAPPVPARQRHRGGYGLIGMRERAETLGGTLHAGPRAEAGWSVVATLPVSPREK
jgi:signal transduction histidine kinase